MNVSSAPAGLTTYGTFQRKNGELICLYFKYNLKVLCLFLVTVCMLQRYEGRNQSLFATKDES